VANDNSLREKNSDIQRYKEVIMKKILLAGLFLLFLSTNPLFCATQTETFESVFSAIPFKNASWVEKITTVTRDDENSPEKVSETSRTVYYKTGKMRVEYTGDNPISNEVEPTVVIYKNNIIYNYMPDRKLCVTYKLDSTLGAGFKPILDMWDGKKTAQKTGEDTMDGVKCGIYEYKVGVVIPIINTTINSNCKEWRDISDNFEVYSEQKTDPYTVNVLFISKTVPSSLAKTRIVDLNKNAGISDDMFEIPKDAEVKSIEELYGGKNPNSPSGEESSDSGNSISGKTDMGQNTNTADNNGNSRDSSTNILNSIFNALGK
jgi:outer membrane lipoprotein-sorting protein